MIIIDPPRIVTTPCVTHSAPAKERWRRVHKLQHGVRWSRVATTIDFPIAMFVASPLRMVELLGVLGLLGRGLFAGGPIDARDQLDRLLGLFGGATKNDRVAALVGIDHQAAILAGVAR